MLFKRPQVRYSDTPEPVTPYQAAAQVWDQRIGSARVQAKNWQALDELCDARLREAQNAGGDQMRAE